MTDRVILREVGDFLAHRIDDEIRAADEAGDKTAISYAIGSRELLSRAVRDIDARPWARREVANFLLRWARLHRTHPDFQYWWG